MKNSRDSLKNRVHIAEDWRTRKLKQQIPPKSIQRNKEREDMEDSLSDLQNKLRISIAFHENSWKYE